MIKAAFYKGKGDLANKIIRWWTRSIYSHCELVFDGVCMSSSMRDGGVRAKMIDLDSGNWDVIDVPWANRMYAHAHWIKTMNQPYGFMDLITSQVFNRGMNDEGAAFCSEWCAEALGIIRASTLSPAGLFDTINNENRRWLQVRAMAESQKAA